MKKTITKSTLAAVALCFSAGSQAATTTTWDFTTGTTSMPYPNVWSYTNAQLKTVRLQAFYADNLANNSTDGTGNSTVSNSLRTSTLNATIKSGNGTTQAGIGGFGTSGVGISNPFDGPKTNNQENSTGGQHAIDNYDYCASGCPSGTASYNPAGGTHAHDFLLFDFNEVLAPQDFRIGWKQFANTDIDFFVAPTALTGTFDLTGQTIQGLLSAGWKQVSFNNVTDCVPNTTGCPTAFSGGTGFNTNMKSRYMIAAGALGGNDDAFKFAQITMNLPSGGNVPIPGTLALLALGAAGIALQRRARKA